MIILLRRILRDFVRDEHGGPLVEFTILMPMFFIMMFGIIEWGNIFYVENNMLGAARQAARSVAVGVYTPANAVSAACGSTGYPATPITGSGYTYTFTFNYNTNCAGASSPSAPTFGNVTMKITTPAVPVSIFNYLGTVTNLNLSAAVTMQQEYVCPAAAVTGTATSQKC